MYAKFFDIGLFRPMQKGGKYDEQKRYNVRGAQNRNCKGAWSVRHRLLLQGTAVPLKQVVLP